MPCDEFSVTSRLDLEGRSSREWLNLNGPWGTRARMATTIFN